MISVTRPACGISNSCQQAIPVGSFSRRSVAFAVERRHVSERKFSRIASLSSNRESVKFLWRFQGKSVQENGTVSMCATHAIPGEPFDNDAAQEMSAEGTNNLHEAKDIATVRLQVYEEHEVDELKNTEDLVEEYKLEETGQLSKVRVSVAGTSRSPTFVEYVSITIKPYLQFLIQSVQRFSIRKYIREYGKKKPAPADVNLNHAVYEPKKGVDNLIQWTSTELTLQHAQMVRIAKDTRYLVWAFGLFGVVRLLEAVVLTFTTRPFHLRKLLDASNALDPLTVAWLAHGMRQPIVAILKVDPSDLEEVNRLKIKFWKELHAFYERQWKVMATLGIARLFNLIATHHPAAQYVTHKLQFLWNLMLSLPLF